MTLARRIEPTGILDPVAPPETATAPRVLPAFVTCGELATRHGYTNVRIRQIMGSSRGWRQNVAGRSLRVYPRAEANEIMAAHIAALAGKHTRRMNDE